MSIEKDLFHNIKNWFANEEQVVDIFLHQIVSTDEASQIQTVYNLLTKEQ